MNTHSGDDIFCGPVGYGCKLLSVQASWDVVFDVLEKRFLKTLHGIKVTPEAHMNTVTVICCQ